ncbi:MAG: PPC domain-containing protein [cyanobacterium endosymbiont of Rhopalodia musculus]|uniref:PPC domain-containing protein n=1 Tax=cyanobacterium endosymbiont of Epithemia clementina EcSB TaxID=3034674 RepID=UPI00248174FA|nr:PPC domain-containing protein [cyanobacterium endosymbiont of Epithemia clementina EcSB]WGT68355.1 PPC domain-containing protein [cyanobacterium endosymbiont of Epithemia clementina EcSB]
MNEFSQTYTCELPQGKTWRVSIIPERDDVDFDLMIEDPVGNIIARDNSTNADAYCTFTSFVGGTYFFRVTSVKGNCKFAIDVNPVTIIFSRNHYHHLDSGVVWKVAVIPTVKNVDFNLYIEDPKGQAIIQDSSPYPSATCVFTSTVEGNYCFRVESLKGMSDFNFKIERLIE